MSDPTGLVQRLCNSCNALRDDGLSCQDYREQSANSSNRLTRACQ